MAIPQYPQKSTTTSNSRRTGVQEFVPLDDQTPASVWRIIILGLVIYSLMSSVWVFSEMPGNIIINGENNWSSDQTWYAASHFCSLGVAALLVWLKR